MRKAVLVLVAAGFAGVGCGGGGGGGGLDSQLKLFLTDAPVGSLDSFVVTVNEAKLASSGGGTVPLFTGPAQIDLLNLVMLQQLLASSSVPPGVYTGVVLTIGGISATAAGVPQTVTGTTFPFDLTVTLEQPLAITPGGVSTLSLDFDVNLSVADGGGNTIIVSPVVLPLQFASELDPGEFEGEDPDDGIPKIEFKGVVTATAAGSATVRIQEVEEDPNGELAGLTSLSVGLGAADIQAEIGNADALDVVPGERVKVRGLFNAGSFEADRVRLRETRFSGTISAVSSTSITLSPIKAEQLTIAGLSSRTFEIGSNTEVKVEDELAIASGNLAVGQTVRLKAELDAGTNSWQALKIQRNGAGFSGPASGLSSISAGGFTLTGDGTNLGLGDPATVPVVVTPNTKIVVKTNSECVKLPVSALVDALGGLSPASTVKVEGLYDGSTLTAARIVLKP